MPNTPVVPCSGAGGGPAGRPSDGEGREAGLRALTYVMLLLFGAAQGLLGTFFYGAGPLPIASVLFAVAILASCLLGGWGTQRATGGLMPAAGWLVTVFVLAMGTSGGSVLITAASAGEIFLFGGAAGATAGVIAAFTLWSKAGLARSRD